eukprot:1948613-Ditylum_brightwellii.AAC.1
MLENNVGVVFKARADEDKCMVGCNGDFLSAPFQCDWCWFQILTKQDPDPHSYVDDHLLLCIRQVNFVICWAKASSMAGTTLTGVQKGLHISKDL